MSGASSGEEIQAGKKTPKLLRFLTALEVALMFAGILAYIWRWHHSAPWSWIGLWALMLVSHRLHRDTPRSLGLTASKCCLAPA